ncbi:hypothetical protein LC607_17590 [Nostoc sp. CHAB 5824]|nr:hypothetical protein [Nostoc sp. CHAB 5824]
MIYRIFFISTLFISSLLLTQCSQPPASSQACNPGDPKNTTYMWRDKNRCEGISKNIPASGGIRLISLTTRAITSFDEKLQLQIPKLNNSNPDVSVRSLAKRYQLDNILFKPEASAFTFSWSTYVLKKENITPESLRALASFLEGSQAVFVPVSLGKSSSEYEFVLYSNNPVEISTFQIRRNGKSIYTSPSRTSQGDEIIFKWKPDKAPKGRYELKYVAELEQFGKSPEKPGEKLILFEHNPAWLQ